MALNFPLSPAIGQVYQAEGASFVWNGALWVVMDATNFPYATTPEAIAGVISDKAISPKTGKDAISARFPPLAGYLLRPAVQMISMRALNTFYQNDSGQPMWVAVTARQTTGAASTVSLWASSDGVSELRISAETVGTSINRRRTVQGVIPIDWFYRATAGGALVADTWVEYRG